MSERSTELTMSSTYWDVSSMLIHRERTLSHFLRWVRHGFIHSLSINGSLDETAWRAPPNHPLDASPPPVHHLLDPWFSNDMTACPCRADAYALTQKLSCVRSGIRFQKLALCLSVLGCVRRASIVSDCFKGDSVFKNVPLGE